MKTLSFKNREPFYKRISRNTSSYLFMAPFAIVFLVFNILPIFTAIYYSFTSFNVLEDPIFIGADNYLKLFTSGDLFLKSLNNTLVIAGIIGPVGYILSFLFAWCINELPRLLRALLTLIFYAPTLTNLFAIWKIFFSGDSYGIVNSYLNQLGIINDPIMWLQNSHYIFAVIIIILLWASLGTSFLAFIAGLQTVDVSLYEAGAIDGVHNRFQELWFITLPAMKPQLLFGAIMSISSSFGVGDLITAVVGMPSPSYSVHTLVHYLQDYGFTRFEMGYACCVAVILFGLMVGANKLIQSMIRRIGH